MNLTFPSISPQMIHAILNAPHKSVRNDSSPSRTELTGIEFETFAEKLREDLAPVSLLEKVSFDRVVTTAWRVHLLAVEDTRHATAGEPFDPSRAQARSATTALKAALALLMKARDTRNPKWGHADHPPQSVDQNLLINDPQDDPSLVFDPLSGDLSNEWPYIADEMDEDEVDDKDLDPSVDDSDIPVRWQDRLVFDESVSETSPVVKGTWVTVSHVVSLIVDGWSWTDILRAHPELTEDDVRTCLAYTAAQDDRGDY